jgi:hypothetical protein
VGGVDATRCMGMATAKWVGLLQMVLVPNISLDPENKVILCRVCRSICALTIVYIHWGSRARILFSLYSNCSLTEADF